MNTTETRRGVVAEFRVGSAVAADALRAVPAARLELDGTTVLGDEGHDLAVWARGVETHLRAFERALTTDDGVRDWRRITDPIAGRTPYRIETAADEPFSGLLTGFDGIVLDAIGTHEGWDVRVLVSNRADLAAVVETWREAGLTIDLTRLRAPSDPADGDSGLTDSQRAMLERALETGYFDVPRNTSLDDLGGEFDISGQSASERLRRGTATLLAHVLPREDAPVPDGSRGSGDQRPERPA